MVDLHDLYPGQVLETKFVTLVPALGMIDLEDWKQVLSKSPLQTLCIESKQDEPIDPAFFQAATACKGLVALTWEQEFIHSSFDAMMLFQRPQWPNLTCCNLVSTTPWGSEAMQEFCKRHPQLRQLKYVGTEPRFLTLEPIVEACKVTTSFCVEAQYVS